MTAPPLPRENELLVGHGRAEAMLARAWRSGRLPHGWLITGPRGVGKATLAFRFARVLLAGEAKGEGLALDPAHPTFRLVASGAHPDLRALERPRDESGRLRGEIGVDAVRQAQAGLRTTAALGGARVLLVDGADDLNRNAANALLKLLEEPPPGVVLLLVAHRPGRVAPTLRSRCARLALRSLPDALVQSTVRRLSPTLDEGQASLAARLAHGSIGRALVLGAIDWPVLYERVLEVVTASPADAEARHALAEQLAKLADARGFGLVAELLGELIRRAANEALGRSPAEVFAGEHEGLRALAAGAPLDRLLDLWDNLARLAGRVEGLYLDRTHALLHVLAQMAPGRAAEPALPGGPHGFG